MITSVKIYYFDDSVPQVLRNILSNIVSPTQQSNGIQNVIIHQGWPGGVQEGVFVTQCDLPPTHPTIKAQPFILHLRTSTRYVGTFFSDPPPRLEDLGHPCYSYSGHSSEAIYNNYIKLI